MISTIDNAENGSGESFDIEGFKSSFEKVMNDDFNSAKAIAVVFEKLKELRKSINDHKTPSNIEEVKSVIKTLVDDVLGIWPQENAGGNEELTKGLVELLIEIRKEARENKNFALSDKVRDDLKELGVQLMDGKEGTSFEID
jgi:cysteinyl-tRNA synthetase